MPHLHPDPSATVSRYMGPHDVYVALCARYGCRPNKALLTHLRADDTCCDAEDCNFEPTPVKCLEDRRQPAVSRGLFEALGDAPSCCGIRPAHRTLHLSATYLGVAGLRPVLGMLRHVRSYSALNLSNNQLSHRSVVEICGMLDGAEHITELFLSHNPLLTLAAGKALSIFVENNPNVRRVDLEGTAIPPAHIHHIQTLLAANAALDAHQLEDKLAMRRRNFADSALQCFEAGRRPSATGPTSVQSGANQPPPPASPQQPALPDNLMYLWQSAHLEVRVKDAVTVQPGSSNVSPAAASLCANSGSPSTHPVLLPLTAVSADGAYPALAMLHDIYAMEEVLR